MFLSLMGSGNFFAGCMLTFLLACLQTFPEMPKLWRNGDNFASSIRDSIRKVCHMAPENRKLRNSPDWLDPYHMI